MEKEENKIDKNVIPTHYLQIGETDTDAARREFRQLVIEVLRNHKEYMEKE